MEISDVINLLIEKEEPYLEIKSFSKLAGIYALFYIGNDFPLLGDTVSKHQIIYIGKTESSQEKRDAKTHFANGKTGSSTVRKSIGSLLHSFENLKPIPRNATDYENGRFSMFKFDNKSEEVITEWMKTNLALSFYEYPKSSYEIEELETKLIVELGPILNIAKNLNNSFREQLMQLRKNCAEIALENSETKEAEQKGTTNNSVKTKMANKNCIIINNITQSDASSTKIRITVENKHLFPMERSGMPITHSLKFTLDEFEFEAAYRAGSKDGISRSGVLRLDKEVYIQKLRIRAGTKLEICRGEDNTYTIQKHN